MKKIIRNTKAYVRDNIKMDIGEIGQSGMDWINLAQDRDQWRGLVNTVIHLRWSLNVREFLSSCSRWQHLREGPATWSSILLREK
jgi:hypothetical protein